MWEVTGEKKTKEEWIYNGVKGCLNVRGLTMIKEAK